MLVKEIVYACLDLAKAATSDDSFFTEDHVMFLCKKYRSFLIKKEIEKEKASGETSSDYDDQQQICLDLERLDTLEGQPCTDKAYLKSTQEIPNILEGTTPRLHPSNFYYGINVCFISRDRMRYVGTNKFLQNIIYASLGPDHHLYLTSNNPQFENLDKIRMSATFEDFEDALDFLCDDECCKLKPCDALDAEFPIKDYLVPTLIELVVKELVGAIYKPKDSFNNANDDLASLATFLRNNVKSALQKQIEG